ncbi:hypothetical protein J6TS7_59670 [Paenibacillus dendritiformis]|nr:hypothetical protein J6TS7_59670 [Paenibacillus dendritiformis]
MFSLIRRLRIYMTKKVESEYQALTSEKNAIDMKVEVEKKTLSSKEIKALVHRHVKIDYLLNKLVQKM